MEYHSEPFCSCENSIKMWRNHMYSSKSICVVLWLAPSAYQTYFFYKLKNYIRRLGNIIFLIHKFYPIISPEDPSTSTC